MKLPRTPAAVVFDMDGLLFDTEVLSQQAIQLAAAEGGHEVAIDVFNRTVGLSWAQSRALLLSHFGEAFPVDQFQEAWVRHFWMIAETRLALKLGAPRTARHTGSVPAPSRHRHLVIQAYRRTTPDRSQSHGTLCGDRRAG